MKKLMNEKETREKLFRHARRIGAEEDLKYIFNKWDRIIALAPSSETIEASRLAILEVQSLLDIHAEDGLTINDELIIPKSI